MGNPVVVNNMCLFGELWEVSADIGGDIGGADIVEAG